MVYLLPNKTADGTVVDENKLKALLTFLDGQISRLRQLRDFIEETNSLEFECRRTSP